MAALGHEFEHGKRLRFRHADHFNKFRRIVTVSKAYLRPSAPMLRMHVRRRVVIGKNADKKPLSRMTVTISKYNPTRLGY